MRNSLFGYSCSLDRKKQYSQSRLHTAPVGLDITWKAPRAVTASVTEVLLTQGRHLIDCPDRLAGRWVAAGVARAKP